MIFQDPMSSLNPVLTIGRQIREALETHFDMNRKAADKRAAELLDPSESRARTSGCATTRTNFRAGCGSAR